MRQAALEMTEALSVDLRDQFGHQERVNLVPGDSIALSLKLEVDDRRFELEKLAINLDYDDKAQLNIIVGQPSSAWWQSLFSFVAKVKIAKSKRRMR